MAKILIIDQDPMAESARSRLAEHEVQVVGDLPNAMASLASGVDVVVCAVDQPGSVAIDLVSSVFGVPVLVSGHLNEFDDCLAAVRRGAAGWVNKPFERNDLLRSVNALLPAA